MNNKYLSIIGLEIHVELKTASKMFCSCKNDPFHAPKPNIYTCPVCLGLPGALPVPNKKAVEWTVMLGLTLGCEIPLESKFDRKNYFYPDLPKGYQISQYDQPLCKNGKLDIKSGKLSNHQIIQSSNYPIEKTIRINRVHLEEDTAKLIHQNNQTLIDFNRSGVPLVEIVTEPDLRSGEEAKLFLQKLHQIIRYLGISDANMEKGSMRLEPNISVYKVPEVNKVYKEEIDLPNYKVEVKNINSFNFVKKAIEYEVDRQIKLLDEGITPKQETRGWDEKKGLTLPQRSKEEAHDYRYFPEPDIPPITWAKSQITDVKSQIPELPNVKLSRFIKDYGLPLWGAERLTENREIAEYFEAGLKINDLRFKNNNIKAKDLANWLLNKKIDISKVPPEELIKQISTAKIVVQVDEKELDKIIKLVLNNNPKAVTDYKSGKTGVIMFLVGMTMKQLKGRGDAQVIREMLEREMGN